MLEQQSLNDQLTTQEFQAYVAAGHSWWNPDLDQGGRVQASRTTIKAAYGGEQLPVLVLRAADGSAEPRPCLYYVANGGKLLQGDVVALSDTELGWVAALDVVLVSVSPRVGPPHPHPAQAEDAYAGLLWIAGHAKELNIDPSKIIILGKSGGGGIAAGTALYARDRGGPGVASQMLIYPMIEDRLIHPSSHYHVPPWTSSDNQAGWAAILGEDLGGDNVAPYAAAARATDLAGLPPTYLEVGSSEVFRDEVINYALRLAAAGVPVELHSWGGAFHTFEMICPGAKVSMSAVAARTAYLERALFELAP
jgi:acetyl esterase/lipase